MRFKTADDTWVPELLALTGSLSFLVATIVVLAYYDHSPLFDWHGLTLNAVVSTFSTANKGLLLLAVAGAIGQYKWVMFTTAHHEMNIFLLIDEASRGPLGCLKLMMYIGRYSLYMLSM